MRRGGEGGGKGGCSAVSRQSYYILATDGMQQLGNGETTSSRSQHRTTCAVVGRANSPNRRVCLIAA